MPSNTDQQSTFPVSDTPNSQPSNVNATPDGDSSTESPGEETPPGSILAPSPLLTLAAFLVGMAVEFIWPSGLLSWSGNLTVGLPLVVLGSVLFAGALWTMRNHGKHPSHSDKPPELIREGPFRYSRNPIYVGHTLAHVGASFLVNSVWPIVTLVPLLLYLRQVMKREEARLESLFGEAYTQYRQNVRRWL